MEARKGDKVRVKRGPLVGVKGVITEIMNGSCKIDPYTGGDTKEVHLADIVNFSSAARKAWEKMPARKVGRPAGSVRADRVSVTFRVDRRLWESFLRIECEGALPERNVLIDRMVESSLYEAKRTRSTRGDQ